MKKYKIVSTRILTQEEKVTVNLEKLTLTAYFVREASKICLSRGFLSWVGRVTGNDNIFLVGLNTTLFWKMIIQSIVMLWWK